MGGLNGLGKFIIMLECILLSRVTVYCCLHGMHTTVEGDSLLLFARVIVCCCLLECTLLSRVTICCGLRGMHTSVKGENCWVFQGECVTLARVTQCTESYVHHSGY